MSTNFVTRKSHHEPITADRTNARRVARRDAVKLQKRAGTKSSRDYSAARWTV